MTPQKKAQVIRIPVALIATLIVGILGWFLRLTYAETTDKISKNRAEIEINREHLSDIDTFNGRSALRDSMILTDLKEIKELLHEAKNH